jgi:hypothetical protein
MKYRELGKTGLKLSVVSYGAASIGNEYGNLDEAQGIRSLRVALDTFPRTAIATKQDSNISPPKNRSPFSPHPWCKSTTRKSGSDLNQTTHFIGGANGGSGLHRAAPSTVC